MKRKVAWELQLAALGSIGMLCSVGVGGCATEPKDADEVDADVSPSDQAPREVGCQAWRTASCQRAEQCGKQASACVTQYRAINCRSEELAEQCAARMEHAACGDTLAGCELEVVADNAAAQVACAGYLQSACASAVRCGFEPSIEQCSTLAELDCQRALGLTMQLEPCLQELATVPCNKWAPPAVCIGAIVLR